VKAFCGEVHSQVAKPFLSSQIFVFFNKYAAINVKKYEGRMLDCSKKQINNG
jgi:hypothetical protein